MNVAARFSDKGQPYEGLAKFSAVKRLPQWTGKVRLVIDHLIDPIRWTKPRRVFVNSMSDLFHEKLTNEEIGAVFGVMASTPKHTFQILTKRAARMREWFEWLAKGGGASQPIRAALMARRYVDDARITGCHGKLIAPWPLSNVWLGVSVENQETANERLYDLELTPAVVRFVSYEPALGPVNFEHWLPLPNADGNCTRCGCNWAYRDRPSASRHDCPPGFRERSLHWIICGGESGRRARPFDVAWARDVAKQCRTAGVACFVKQLGADPHDSARSFVGGWEPGDPEPDTRIVLKDHKGGNPLEWPKDVPRLREFPRAAAGASA